MKYDVIVVGGGIVGLATAYKLLESHPGLKLLLMEKEGKLALHQTGNNSGVIHSGVYYKPGSEKARNCFRGYQMLLDFCREEDVPFELCGKVIVATDESELPQLQQIMERGIANGLEGLTYLNKEEIAGKEPHVRGIKGIWVPQAGIVDYSVVSQKYATKIEERGGEILMNHKVHNLQQSNGHMMVETNQGDFSSNLVVTCGGLYSDRLAKMTGVKQAFKILPFRGEYYELKPEKHHLVKGLIYPVPNPAFPFLGVHFTKMIQGGVEAGPNAVLAYRREGYTNRSVYLPELFETLTYPGFIKIAGRYWKDGMYELYRSYSKKAFVKALQKLIPEVKSEDLVRGGAGVRAQACDPKGNLLDDFLIEEGEKVVHVCNAPSPAATSSLSIGTTISEMVLAKLN